MSHPIILPPSTPSELMAAMLARHAYNTTIFICWPRTDFAQALAADIQLQKQRQQLSEHPLLLPPSIDQLVAAKHIRLVFVPSVVHLRAALATFSSPRSRAESPPLQHAAQNLSKSPSLPLCLVYGFIHLHRDGSEWSAQGLGISASLLIMAASRNSLIAAITDAPSDPSSSPALDLPILSGCTRRPDGSWNGPTVPIGAVCGRWFQEEQPVDAESNDQAPPHGCMTTHGMVP